MQKRLGREVAMLTLPILILSALILFKQVNTAREGMPKAVLIERWVPNGADINYFRVSLTLEWPRSWLDRRTSIPFKCQSRLLDADKKVVAVGMGYTFGRNQSAPQHDYYFDPCLEPLNNSQVPWKEPLSFQSSVFVDNYPPLRINAVLPGINCKEKPRPSNLPFFAE